MRAATQIGEIRSVLEELAVAAGTDVTLGLRMEPASGPIFSTALGPDRVVVGIVGTEGFVELGHLDGGYLFLATRHLRLLARNTDSSFD